MMAVKHHREAEVPRPDVGRLRLLVALDALLVEGSVSGAARALDLSTPAMSRLLSQLRVMFGDELMVRTGRGMVPTPLAESLRTRIRALAAEATDLMHPHLMSLSGGTPEGGRYNPLVQHPPLAVNPLPLIEGQPDPVLLSRRLAGVEENVSPWLSLARYVAIAGGGSGRPRPLSAAEAEEAFSIILDGEADPVQIGALLVAIHYRGLNVNELAGMTRAARRACLPLSSHRPAAEIDWPAYLSPRTTTPPWFLHAARLTAQAGYRTLLHGFDKGVGRLDDAIDAASIPRVFSVGEARSALDEQRIAYMPLSAIDPQLQALCSLYRFFQMRSPLNVIVQMLNPLAASVSLFGVPSPSTQSLQREAASMLGWRRMIAVTSRRDVAQATPGRVTSLLLLQDGHRRELKLPAVPIEARDKPHAGFNAMEYWAGVWSGAVIDQKAIETILMTTSLALMYCDLDMCDYSTARRRAAQLWNERRRS